MPFRSNLLNTDYNVCSLKHYNFHSSYNFDMNIEYNNRIVEVFYFKINQFKCI
jgi:hypothetical protein